MTASAHPGSARRISLPSVGLVALGGALGTLTRYLLGGLAHGAGDALIYLLVVNILGSFALGLLLAGLSPRKAGVDRWRSTRLFLGTGVLGGFTSYSAFVIGSVQLAGGAEGATAVAIGLAMLYAVATVSLGCVASWLGLRAGAAFAKQRHAVASGPGEEPST